MNYRATFSAMALAGLLALPAAATPEFAPVLQDHMVLQRGEPVTLWGTAAEGETVSVEWKGHKAAATTHGGAWKVVLPASAADAGGSTITATDSSGSATLCDVLVGDVWLAGGQSNMEWRIRQSEPVPAGTNTDNPQVRLLNGTGKLFTPPPNHSNELRQQAAAGRDYEWEWKPCTADTIQDFSAVGTYFALQLQETQQVPIGIICNARGGSPMESWLPPAHLNSAPFYADFRGKGWLSAPTLEKWVRWRAGTDLATMPGSTEEELQHPFAPGFLYRNAIEPLRNLAIRGVIWYQGEANAETADISCNTTKITDLITTWRETFRNPALPFLMVQLPRINTPTRPFWPEFREAQARAAREVPGVGLICTIDLGTTDKDVHPRHKHPVGQRLAELARGMVYAEKGLPGYPQVTDWKAGADSLTITFDRALRTTDGKPPRGFVAGIPTRPESFTELPAAIKGNTVVLTLPRPWQEGMAWRYINTTFAEPNLVGAEGGLPAFPARSDR